LGLWGLGLGDGFGVWGLTFCGSGFEFRMHLPHDFFVTIEGLWFRVYGQRYRVEIGAAFQVPCLGFRISYFLFLASVFGFQVFDFRCLVSGIQDLGCRVQGLG
jgi:hypothetical protein